MDIRRFLSEDNDSPSKVSRNIFMTDQFEELSKSCLPSQKLALHGMITGRNICLTGSAGTGKTHLIQIFKKWAQQNNKKMAVTALTGTAAFLLGGKTIHSWSGIGLGTSSVESIIEYD